MTIEDKKVIGRAERVTFPELDLDNVHARIDTGAKTSALWASSVFVHDGVLEVVLFGEDNPYFTGKPIRFERFEPVAVASSSGHVQKRYKVRLLVRLKGKKVRAWFTLADRSAQVYPVLIGRNVLLGKFVVDVKKGHTLSEAERRRSQILQDQLDREEEA